ncbi:sugar phosphate isomerase/epimerase family protein [Pseudactinotalea suaedae]|uniref:sugar phosphate isomerase/epimerase family protein n=1 Tax=Pseudactinotalea suaedae TaxID=1524924 RepID=UPI0013917B69|nr:sugar phosphate isomerase/epimerase family protein [Pseudactinotalea suaedae]
MSAGARLSVATICFDGFGDEDFVPTFELAPQLGVADLEINAWYGRNLTPSGLDGLAGRCRHAGLRPATLQVSPFAPGPDAADLTREVSRWLWLVEAAHRLDVGVIKATGSARDTRGGLSSLVDLLRTIAPVAEQHGLTLVLENHVGNVIEHPDDYREIFAAVPSSALKVCLDTGHFVASGHDPATVAAELGERVTHIDLKDCAGPGPGQFVRFGEGVVDFDAVLAQAITPGWSGFVVVELPLVDRATVIADLQAGVQIASRHLPPHNNPQPVT